MHIVFSRGGEKLKIFRDDGTEIFACEARNRTVEVGEGHDGQCPLGSYQLGVPEKVDPPEVPFGFWFTPIVDINGLWAYHHRAGLGLHGGGSGLAAPFANKQGWQITEGCIRLQNEDNQEFVGIVAKTQAGGEAIKFSVVA